MRTEFKQKLVSYAGFYTGALFALGSVLYKWLWPDSNFNLETAGIFSILVTLLGDRWGAMLDREKENLERAKAHEELSKMLVQLKTENKERVDTLYKRLQAFSNLTNIGPADVVPPQIVECLKSARTVWNTFVQLGNFANRSSDEKRKLLDCYESVLKNPGTNWHDIVSINELFDDRYQKIFPHVSAASDQSRGRHEIVVLRHNVPLINFILIEGPTGFDLFFGWVLAERFPVSPIFHSREKALVEMFRNYFHILEQKSFEGGSIFVDYSESGSARLAGNKVVDRMGVWVSIAYKRSGEQNNGTARSTVVDATISSIAILAIDVENGRVTVGGKVHYPAERRAGMLTATNVLSTTQSLMFDYENDVEASPSAGQAVYLFENNDDGERLRGFLVTEKHRDKLDLIGSRIPAYDLAAVGRLRVEDPLVVKRVQEAREYLRTSKGVNLLPI